MSIAMGKISAAIFCFFCLACSTSYSQTEKRNTDSVLLLNDFGAIPGCGDMLWIVQAKFTMVSDDTVVFLINCPGDIAQIALWEQQAGKKTPIININPRGFWKKGSKYKITYSNSAEDLSTKANYHYTEEDLDRFKLVGMIREATKLE